MKSLFVLRIAALLFRPVVVFVEGEILPGENILPFSLPIVMIGMLVASTPVYQSFYRLKVTSSQDQRNSAQAVYYASTVLNLFLGLIFVSVFAWSYIDSSKMPMLVSALCFVGMLFLIEKISDEIARFLEFRKQFYLWTLLQFAKSSWLLIPIFIAFKVGSYSIVSFLFAAIFVATLLIVISYQSKRVIKRMSFRLCLPAISSILSLSHFVLPQLTIPLVRQFFRLMVSRLYPDVSHIYLALAQVMQASAVYFNVKYQIPYRKILSIKPMLFLSKVRKVYEKSALAILVGLAGLLVMTVLFGFPNDMSTYALVLLSVALGLEAVSFTISTNMVAFFQWVTVGFRIRIWLYVLLILVSALPTIFGAQILPNNDVSMIYIPLLSSCVALTGFWVSYLLLRFAK